MNNNTTRTKRLVILIGLVLFGILYMQMRPLTPREEECTKGNYQIRSLDSLYQGANITFLSSGHCDNCHGLDPLGIASTTGEGADVNLVDDWSSTMMANSARDPFWRAKVSHEVFTNPALESEIEGTCTRCHAPLGRFDAIINEEPDYFIEDMLMDSVALDGVSCLACHRQAPQPEVALHTGQLNFTNQLVAYGQYTSPLISPMAQATGYVPEQAAHISDSKLCAGCHSLVTGTVDLEGNLTGDEFVEQATWHEWLNSSYPDENTTCQSCHLPKIGGDDIVLAAGYDTPPRPDFALHTMAGANTLMLKLMRDNREALGIFASESQFDETIAATNAMLQEQSLDLEIINQTRTADTLFVDVKLHNKAGHKLPSGYPARRMSVHFSVLDDNGDEIFRSGDFDSNYAISSEDNQFEPHYDIIDSEDEVQIYEMVMGDVAGNRTTVLTRGFSHLKDNRLVPEGFSTSNTVYDTTAIVLNTSDLNFNFDPTEGSGTDIIQYKIPMNGYYGVASVNVDVYYQSLPPVWLGEILSVNTPEIQTFSAMFNDADKSPVLMKSTTASVASFINVANLQNMDAVNIMRDMSGKIWLNVQRAVVMQAYDVSGKFIGEYKYNEGKHNLPSDMVTGTYLLLFVDVNGNRQIEKILR